MYLKNMLFYILKIIIFINASIIHCTYTIIEVLLSLKLDFILYYYSFVSFAILYYNNINVFQCVRANFNKYLSNQAEI